MSVNVLTLHSGSASADAAFSGSWTYWDDYQRVSMGNNFDFEDAMCVGSNAGQQYCFVSPRAAPTTGVVVKITDGSPPTATTYTKSSFSGKGSDICYDATNNKVYVLWADIGNITITKMDVATWTEDATTTFTGYDDSSKPSICMNAANNAIYVLTCGGTDAHPTRLLKITGLASFGSATVAEALPFYVGNRCEGHCIRLDPTDTNSVYCSGFSSVAGWRARVNISSSPMTITWESTELPHGLPTNSAYLAFHDDIAFDSSYVYLIGAVTSGSAASPGGIKVNKATGTAVDAYYDTAVYEPTIQGVGLDVNRTTREIMASQGSGLGLPIWSIDDHKMRQRNTPDGLNPDDLMWSDDGSIIWSVPAVQFWPGRPTYVTRWSQIAGPIGIGRVKAQLNAAASFTIGSAHAATNTGVYAGLSFCLDDFAYAIDHATLLTLTTDGTTGTWQARLEVTKTSGQLRLAFPDGTETFVATLAAGWHFVELRYDKTTSRFRVYVDNGTTALDITKGSSFNAGQTVFGPWDASGADTEVLKVHTAYDIQLDDANYDGSRWGEITALFAQITGANASYQQWATVGGGGFNHSNAINDVPDFLTPSTADDGDSTYIQSDGSSVTDQWDIFTNLRYTQQVPTMRAVRLGCLAKVVSGSGSFYIGWNGEGLGTPADTWTLNQITPSGASYAHYGTTFYTTPAGGFPLVANNHGYFAFKQVASAGVNVRITQAVLSLVGSTQSALSFTAAEVTDTTPLDIPSRGFASQGVFDNSSPRTLNLDIPSRAFAARDLLPLLVVNASIGGSVCTATALSPSASANILAFAVVATASALSPAGLDVMTEPAVVTMATALSPTASVIASSNVSAVVATATALSPSAVMVTVIPAAVATAAALCPSASVPGSVLAVLAVATALSPAANVFQGVSVSAVVCTASALAPDAAVAWGSTVAAPKSTATALSPSANVFQGVSVTAVICTADALAPSAAIANTVVVVVSTASALSPAATVFVFGGSAVLAVVCTATALAPAARIIGSLSPPITYMNAQYAPTKLMSAEYAPTFAGNAQFAPETDLVGRFG